MNNEKTVNAEEPTHEEQVLSDIYETAILGEVPERKEPATTPQIFSNPEFGNIRTVTEGGKVLFCGKDVAEALGYKDSRHTITRHCKGGMKRPVLTEGGTQSITFIPEGDVYRLICNSTLPTAEKFERWVFDEVLPSIRKHGAFITPNKVEEIIADPDTFIKLLTELKREREQTKALEAKCIENEPKVLFADAVSTSKTDILVGNLAKLIRQNGIAIGQNRLFDWLRNNGYLIKQKGALYNTPTQRSMDMGIFRVKETAIVHNDGSTTISKTVKVTGKGQIYFVNIFLKKKAAA